MVKLFAVAMFLAGCGRSECDDYVRVLCIKMIACDAPVGFRSVSQDACERETKKGTDASRANENECATARDFINSLTCARFREVVDTVLGR